MCTKNPPSELMPDHKEFDLIEALVSYGFPEIVIQEIIEKIKQFYGEEPIKPISLSWSGEDMFFLQPRGELVSYEGSDSFKYRIELKKLNTSMNYIYSFFF